MKTRNGIFLLLGLGAIAWLTWAQWQSSAVAVSAAPMSQGPLTEHVEERAKTRLEQLHRVTMPQAGLVQPQPIEVGMLVNADQLLARLDMRPLELAIAETTAMQEEQAAILAKSQDNSLENRVQAQAERLVESVAAAVEAAEERVQAGKERAAFSERIRDRLRNVASASSKNEVERAELQAVEAVSSARQDDLIASASRAIEAATILLPKMVTDYIARKKLDDAVTAARQGAATAKVQQAKLRADEASLRSPVDGVVLESMLKTPQHLGFGETVFVVGALEELEIETDILSEDAVRVNNGDRCVVFGPALAAAPDGALEGVVTRVSPNAFTKVSSLGVEQQRVNVVIRLEPAAIDIAKQAGLGVGYQVDVRIITDRREDARQVPRSALFRNRQQQWEVFVVEDGVAKRRQIQIGIQSDTHAEVLAGLDDQDLIITEPESRIQEGTRVTTAE